MNAMDFDAPPETDELQGELRRAVDAIRAVPPPVVDFGARQRRRSQEMASVDPTQATISARRTKRMRRLVTLTAAAALLVCVSLGITHFGMENRTTAAFAETLEQIQRAKTMTWKTTFYEHITSKDRKRTWLHTGVIECAYKAPSLYRDVRLDDNGQVESVEIRDCIHGRKLTYSPKEKKATLAEITPSTDDSGPFAFSQKELDASNLQWVGTRNTATGVANVFRHGFRWYVGGEECDRSYDFWVDAKTKRLVATGSPGADVYDPEHDPNAGNPAEKDYSSATMMGGWDRDIRYDVTLDDSLFRTEPPEGYTVEIKPRDHITEKEMIEYLGIVAEFNDKTFPDEEPTSWKLLGKINRANRKPRKEQTAAERKLLETDMHYGWRFRTSTDAPILDFFFWNPDNTVKDSFRYLGKGVTLGDKDRIVCWYKLKDAKEPKTYRVVYGDMSIKDVAAEDLPLPVEP